MLPEEDTTFEVNLNDRLLPALELEKTNPYLEVQESYTINTEPFTAVPDVFSTLGEPYAAITETYSTLDTIEEGKEGSLSGDSNDFKSKENQPENSVETKEELKKEPNKIKIQWMNEDDEDDDFEPLEKPREEEIAQWHPTHPNIDQGWAWVVLVACFFIFCLHSGLLSSTGLYYQQMLLQFGHSRSYTAWLGSLMNAFFMLAGPFSSVIIKRAGCRASIILGSILMTIGYLASAMASSLAVIFFSYGVIVEFEKLRH